MIGLYDGVVDMTMHLLPAFFTTSVNSRKSKNKPKSQKQIDHEKWLKAQGLSLEQLNRKKVVDTNWKKEYTKNIKVETKTKYESSGMSGSKYACAKRDIMTNLHKEPEHVRKEILAKASRVMPLYNKGGLQLALPSEDMTMVGSKTRRG
jgi:hypothetical protein